MSRETLEYDVVIVGGGPAGLSTAIRLRQLAGEGGADLSVCVLEKGSEIGAHILSGAVLDPRALNELIPGWRDDGAPVGTPVRRDEFYFLTGDSGSLRVPGLLVPASMHNRGNYVISLGELCRWLAQRAESLGVEIFPGFAASEILFAEDGTVAGVATGDMGVAANGEHKPAYEPGVALRARRTVFAEGCRGHLGRRLIGKFGLDADRDPQHYGIGLKELWEVPAGQHVAGTVVHAAGWPLAGRAAGGAFLYHFGERLVSVGLIVDLNYRNPYVGPFDEFQRMKHHPLFSRVLEGGRRLAYGARAITKGGWNSLPRMSVPGALLVGCEAGTLNFARIKGIHAAMKSGMLAAEFLHRELGGTASQAGSAADFGTGLRESWLGRELRQARNFGPALHRLGLVGGAVFNFLDQSVVRGRMPFTLHDREPDHAALEPAADHQAITYPKPDGKLSFDRLSSVYVSNTNHEEDQPCHLLLGDPSRAISVNLNTYAAPEQRYCPAGVYEIVDEGEGPRLQINAQNCVHCKTCDIKDPTGNITWVTPEGGGGPNYPNM